AQIIRLKVRVLATGSHKEPALIWLGFTNDLQAKPERDGLALTSILPTGDPQTLSIPMRGNMPWSLGGYCREMAIYFPQVWQVKLLELATDDGGRYIPRIGFRHNLCWERSGYMLISSKRDTWDLSFDVRNVQAARSATLEITKPNAVFEVANAAFPSPYTAK